MAETANSTSARVANEPPTLSPAEARRAAALADARAAEATAVADRAKSISKKARAAATKASTDAAKFRAAAEDARPHREKLSVAEAKAKLLDAARKIHPLQDARDAAGEHPFVTVGIAAGAGAILGASGGTLGKVIGSGVRLATTLLSISRPLLIALGKFAAAQALARQSVATSPPTDPTPMDPSTPGDVPPL